jgi:AhpD family alkylhydroperoxidase
MAWVDAQGAADGDAMVLYDPQTSGGLLIAMPEGPARQLVDEMRAMGHESTAVIGRVMEKSERGGDGKVFVSGSIAQEQTGNMKQKKNEETEQPQASCCDSAPDMPENNAGDLFAAFMKAANAPGLIDARSKKLMAITLSIAQRCDPCLKIHFKSALAMGIGVEEIDEAANLAIAFGGCTAMMFYKEIRQQFAGRS